MQAVWNALKTFQDSCSEDFSRQSSEKESVGQMRQCNGCCLHKQADH